MLSLAFDTATPWGRFALAEDGQLLAELPHNVTSSYADALLPLITRLLNAAGRDLAQVGAVGVACGPGSFTGVRIGMATAKGLAWALGARLVPVPTLAAMAAALLAEWPDRQLAVPALDARRGELFAAVYARRGSWVEPLAAAAALPPDAWWARLRAVVPDLSAPVWGGDGVGLLVGEGARLRPELAARGEPVARAWSAAHPATARVLALAMTDPRADLPEVHPFAAVPLYLRASEAEIRRSLDLTPAAPDFAPLGGGTTPEGADVAEGALNVRPGKTADLPAVERIERASFADPWPAAALREELQPDALRLPLVAERDGAVIAYIMLWRAADELHILNLAVAVEERRRGSGSQLLRAALAEAEARGLKMATLEVRASNALARRFYAAHGFAPTGRRRGYYRDTGEDAIIMTRRLRDPAS